ncbi:MAG: hypothetical protein NTNFB02_23480 [Nitrospira sp.]
MGLEQTTQSDTNPAAGLPAKKEGKDRDCDQATEKSLGLSEGQPFQQRVVEETYGDDEYSPRHT